MDEDSAGVFELYRDPVGGNKRHLIGTSAGDPLGGPFAAAVPLTIGVVLGEGRGGEDDAPAF